MANSESLLWFRHRTRMIQPISLPVLPNDFLKKLLYILQSSDIFRTEWRLFQHLQIFRMCPHCFALGFHCWPLISSRDPSTSNWVHLVPCHLFLQIQNYRWYCILWPFSFRSSNQCHSSGLLFSYLDYVVTHSIVTTWLSFGLRVSSV